MNFYKKTSTLLICLSFLLISMMTTAFTFSNGVKSADTIRKPSTFNNGKINTAMVIDPPVLTATGDQVYCPGTSIKIVTNMTITSDPTDNSTSAVYIQISSGYVNGQDILSLSGSHPNLTTSWDATAGKLTIFSPLSATVLYSDFENAIEDVIYSSNAVSPSGTKIFSITIGKANYLPSTGHYYEFVPSLGITWNNAKTAAAARSYFGLQGYLATITAADEAKLSGEQASGAGWIGGSDNDTEGVWKWMTGPEAGTIFWNGNQSGSTPNYAFWNSGEPNNAGNENYAHVTAPGVGITGSWNDLSNEGSASGDYQPKGYIVEYGGMPGDPVLNISTSTKITIPQITSSVDASRCGNGTVTLSATTDSGTIKWYDAPNTGNLLATGSTFTTPNLSVTTIFYADSFEIGCATATRKPVVATINDIPVLSVTNPAPFCEGSVSVSASTTAGQIRWFANDSDTTPLATGNTYTISNITETTTLYVDAINNGCVSGAKIPMLVTVNPKPVVNDDTLSICENGTLILDAGITNVLYEWNPGGATTKLLTISDPGTFSVKVTTPEGCSSVKTFTIIEKFAPVISDININGTTVTINTTQAGDFEYSIDGKNYQASNVFTVTTGGINTAYVRETNFCGQDEKDFIVIIVPLFFTPNNDSYNDTWVVPGMALYPKAKISIFDRYGKLVFELNRNNLSWNGTHKGYPLPSSDYWFVMKIDDTFPEVKGHFSLIR